MFGHPVSVCVVQRYEGTGEVGALSHHQKHTLGQMGKRCLDGLGKIALNSIKHVLWSLLMRTSVVVKP